MPKQVPLLRELFCCYEQLCMIKHTRITCSSQDFMSTSKGIWGPSTNKLLEAHLQFSWAVMQMPWIPVKSVTWTNAVSQRWCQVARECRDILGHYNIKDHLDSLELLKTGLRHSHQHISSFPKNITCHVLQEFAVGASTSGGKAVK